jgi:hypothetical protein
MLAMHFKGGSFDELECTAWHFEPYEIDPVRASPTVCARTGWKKKATGQLLPLSVAWSDSYLMSTARRCGKSGLPTAV